VSPGGCLYATQSERIIKITKADGACSLLSDSSAPQLLLTPENVQPSPVQGTTVTFTATLKNVASPANIPVTLFVNGANQGLHLINTDSTGKSVFTYTGIATGNDRVSASADLGTSTISSNEATVNWTAGKHTSFLSLNQSPTSSVPNQSILLTANLVDVSVTPPVPLSGASVTLMLASQSCLATTNGAGVASCSIAPALAAGKYTLNATFAGTGALLGSSANQGFEILQSLPAVQFSAAAYSVNEGGGSVAITVTRTGDTASPATVDYRTTDVDTFTVNCAAKNGAAFARCDFATVVGSVSFAGGETSKSFNVPIIDDAYGEGPETFSLVLSNPTSATLGVPLTTTVTINDNETVDGPNPILQTNSSGVNFFVRQHYLDFLGREPEVGEPWSAILNGCADQFNTNPASPSAGCDRITVSGSFFGSPEFKDKGLYIIGMYRVAFNRLPTYVEFSIDLASITGTDADVFAKRAAYAGNFVQRSEFTNIYAAMTNTQFVNALMSGAQGQNYNLTSITTRDPANPDTGAKVTLTTAELINRLTAGTMTRGQVLRAIAQSDEIAQIREAVNAFVASQYYGYLRRTPETAGFNSWVNHLTANPNDFRTMVHGFLNSTEYRSRFGPL
jgi:hypothetical protein